MERETDEILVAVRGDNHGNQLRYALFLNYARALLKVTTGTPEQITKDRGYDACRKGMENPTVGLGEGERGGQSSHKKYAQG